MKLFSKMGLIALATVMGAAIGGFAVVFLRLLYKGIEFLWYKLPHLLSNSYEIPFYTLILCIAGGLLVGLCQRYLGDHPKSFQESLASFRKTGRFDYKHIGQGMTTASLSLLFGASLGPEAALMDMVGGLSTWTGDQLTKVGKSVGIINKEADDPAWPRNWKFGLIGAAVTAGIVGFSILGGHALSSGWVSIDTYQMHWADLVYAIPIGLAGALGSLFYVQLQNYLPFLTDKLKQWPVLRSVSGGLVFGILASIFPLVLFSGQKELQILYDSQMSYLAWFILLTGLAKFFVTSLLLSTGWKGGHILPVAFAGAAVGLGLSLLLPGVPPAIGYVGGMTGATVVIIRKPIVIIPTMVLLFSWQLMGVVTIAVLIGYLISAPLSEQREDSPAADPVLNEHTKSISAD